MLKKLQVIAVLMCVSSYAGAGAVSIGTASARGDMRVDSYTVKGNATLFNGSVVETGQASADLRLAKGTEITMATDSRGTLYRDRLVLQRGKSELAATKSFQLEAIGLHVTPSAPNSRGIVSMRSAGTVEVAAVTGSFGVTNNQGILLANVRPGVPVSFAVQAGGEAAKTFTATGKVNVAFDGRYYLVTKTGAKYEIRGSDLARLVGKTVKITGTIAPETASTAGVTAVVAVTAAQTMALGGAVATSALVVGGVAVAGGAGIAVGVYEVNQNPTPASR